ncbi:MAG: energy-coupling factor transporter transmembrane component T [Pelolinea sp.]|nr:energy-coupling factor transporter transmembrane component T [Pelolinea sp.]
MSQFEYLRNVSIGQYLRLGSPIHRLDPRAKIIGFSLLIIAISISISLTALLIALFVSVLLIAFSRISFSYAVRGLLPPLPFLVLIALFQLVITPQSASSSVIFEYWKVSISMDGVYAALRLMVRFPALLLVLTMFSSTVSTIEMIDGLDLLLNPLQKIGLKTQNAALLIQITLRFIPFLAMNAEHIAKSQAARGANWDAPERNLITRVRQIVPLIIPLFTTSLRQAENLSTAMLARGLGSTNARTSMHSYSFKLMDGMFLLLSLLTFAGILFFF